jgi:hypothetical protein
MGAREQLAFTHSAVSDPDGAKLRALLRTHDAYARARRRRELMVNVVAGLSVFVWVHAAWPAHVAPSIRALALTAWALAFSTLAVALFGEHRCRRRLDLRLAQLPPLPVDFSARPRQ